MTEYPAHIKGKTRMFNLLKAQPDYQNVKLEKPTGIFVPTTLGPKEYTADVYAEKIITNNDTVTIQKIAIEIDGKHHSKAKDSRRDAILLEHGIRTVRFPTPWVHGRKKLDDETLLAQIVWSLKQ